MLGLKLLLVAGATAALFGLSNALLLSNLMGCSSLACRLVALEADVGNLKRSVNKLEINLGTNMQNMNQYRPTNQFNQMPGTNPNTNGQQGMNQQGFNQGQQGGTQPSNQQLPVSGDPNKVNFANVLPSRDFNSNINYQQQLQRLPQNGAFQSNLPTLRV